MHRRQPWVQHVMKKYFSDWLEWDEQVPIFDIRGLDEKTVQTVGIALFTRMMPRADVIAIKKDRLLIIEFSRMMDPLHVQRLARYIDAIRHEYVRVKWRDMPIEGIYVTPGYDARIEAECGRLGFRYLVEPEPKG